MQRLIVIFSLCFTVSCGQNDNVETADNGQQAADSQQPTLSAKKADVDTLANGEPKFIEVQHILISFQGRGTKATRSQADAQLLAIEVLAKAQCGEDFDALV